MIRSLPVLALTVLALCGCTAPEAAPPTAPATPPTTTREVVVVPQREVTAHGGHVLTHPGVQDDAEVGVTYTHSVFAHCGGRFTQFDSRSWDAGYDPFDAGGAKGYVAGTMTLVGRDLARFEVGGRVIDYHPTAAGTPIPLCA